MKELTLLKIRFQEKDQDLEPERKKLLHKIVGK